MAKPTNKRDSWVYQTAYGWNAVVLAVPFMGAGAYFTLTGLDVVPLPSKANAPLWVIAAVGFSFFLAGVLVFVNGLRGVAVRRRRKRLEALHPDRPWLLDFDWNQGGIHDRAATRWVGALVSLVFIAVFLAPFHWWAFASGEGPLMVQIGVVLFTLLPLWLLYQVVYLFAQYVKYGRARLRFVRFPYEPGDTIEVVFSPNRFHVLDCTLRFLEERLVDSGSGENRSTRHVVEQHYESKQRIEVAPTRAEVSIAFSLPDNAAWVTALSESPVRYWELDIRAEDPGIDFHASFPLPVYASQRGAVREPVAI